jgi:flavin reductase (DIM6/NTAB) family NADH-FMN oxidoreductase RutF
MSPLEESATSTPASADTGAALGRIPSGLFVISWRTENRDRVMLASWVMQAGFAPPMVSVAVAPSREFLAAARGGLPFVVNVLSEHQRTLLARFGKPIAEGEEPFAGLAVERTTDHVAAITEAASWLACRMVGEALVDGADHVIVVGRVEAARGNPDVSPVVHLRRNGLKY